MNNLVEKKSDIKDIKNFNIYIYTYIINLHKHSTKTNVKIFTDFTTKYLLTHIGNHCQ